jgi:hypothetical protein
MKSFSFCSTARRKRRAISFIAGKNGVFVTVPADRSSACRIAATAFVIANTGLAQSATAPSMADAVASAQGSDDITIPESNGSFHFQ